METLSETVRVKRIFEQIEPFFTEKLGTYTHQRISGEWHFRGLAYVRDEMTYIFGFNLGFFKEEKMNQYEKVGMNVLIRTNGINKKLRMKYADFFCEKLKTWYFNISQYSSFRGGTGIELERYKKISDFDTDEQMIDYLKECINGLHSVYEHINENPDNIFDDVLRGAFPWHDTIFDVADKVLNKN